MHIKNQLFNGIADLAPDWLDAFGVAFDRDGITVALVFVLGA